MALSLVLDSQYVRSMHCETEAKPLAAASKAANICLRHFIEKYYELEQPALNGGAIPLRWNPDFIRRD